MKLPLAQISELEQLEATATAQLAQAKNLRSDFIAKLDELRGQKTSALAGVASCKQSEARFQEIADSASSELDNVLTQLAELEEIERSARNTISVTQTTLKKEHTSHE